MTFEGSLESIPTPEPPLVDLAALARAIEARAAADSAALAAARAQSIAKTKEKSKQVAKGVLREINRLIEKPSVKAARNRNVSVNLDITLAMAKLPFSVGQVTALDMVQGENGKRAMRGCLFCKDKKTPQWRLGPLGPHTLCNRCGVKYRKEAGLDGHGRRRSERNMQ